MPSLTGTEKLTNKIATTLYNGMVHPIIGYTIKGCIWYQGETNYERPDQYEKLFPAMVQEWRTEWGQGNFPFYYAQIAPYNYNYSGTRTEKMNSAYLRDAQRKAMTTIPASNMVVRWMMAKKEPFIHPIKKS
ncbi:MAG: sialate O-acetylesterase [Ferruginibacter sp.]